MLMIDETFWCLSRPKLVVYSSRDQALGLKKGETFYLKIKQSLYSYIFVPFNCYSRLFGCFVVYKRGNNLIENQAKTEYPLL